MVVKWEYAGRALSAVAAAVISVIGWLQASGEELFQGLDSALLLPAIELWIKHWLADSLVFERPNLSAMSGTGERDPGVLVD